MATTSIEWADAVWNPTVGCTAIAPGCANCYAVPMARRVAAMAEARAAKRFTDSDSRLVQAYSGLTVIQPNGRRAWSGQVRCLPERLVEPLRWSTPRRVFVNSMSDLFHEDVPFEFIDRVFVYMTVASRHTFIVLTKRAARMREYMTARAASIEARPSNVILGVSVSEQTSANELIPDLVATPAACRAVSYEPALGQVNFEPWLDRLGWIIFGGESGHGARPCNIDWARAARDQCRSAGVPFFLKQLGGNPRMDYYEDDDHFREWCLDRGDTVVPGQMGEYPHDCRLDGQPPPNALQEFRFDDSKGGDEKEWPADLRGCRAWPTLKGAY